MSRTPSRRDPRAEAPALGIVAIFALIVGCTAPAARRRPGARSASQRHRPLQRRAIRPGRVRSEPAATPQPSGSPPVLAFETPDDILPPWALVEVAVDNLQLRGAPGLSARRGGYGAVGPALSGGLRVWAGSGRRPGLVPVGHDGRFGALGRRWIWRRPVPGGRAAGLHLRGRSRAGDRGGNALLGPAGLFGDRSMTFEGTYGCDGCGGTAGATSSRPGLRTR